MAFLAPDNDVAIGPLQFECLVALWIHGESSVHSVREEVNRMHARGGRPQLAYTTFLTVLRNLHKRGVVTRATGKRAHVYKAVRTEDSFMGELGRQFLGAYYGGDIKNLQEAIAHSG